MGNCSAPAPPTPPPTPPPSPSVKAQIAKEQFQPVKKQAEHLVLKIVVLFDTPGYKSCKQCQGDETFTVVVKRDDPVALIKKSIFEREGLRCLPYYFFSLSLTLAFIV
jgi:hypothetical protein